MSFSADLDEGTWWVSECGLKLACISVHCVWIEITLFLSALLLSYNIGTFSLSGYVKIITFVSGGGWLQVLGLDFYTVCLWFFFKEFSRYGRNHDFHQKSVIFSKTVDFTKNWFGCFL